MKTAIIVATNDNTKSITITGSNLTLHEEGFLLNIKDDGETVFTILLNNLVYVKLSK